ncbi:hypothetical protein Dimus_039405 [Dionaea muscipula]
MALKKDTRYSLRQAWKTSFKGIEKTSIFDNFSVLTPTDLDDIKRCYPHSSDFEVYLSTDNEIAVNIDKEKTLAIHFDHLKCGLRLPFDSFFSRVLTTFDLLPVLLTPMSIAQIISFIIICREHRITPSMELFMRVLYLKRDSTTSYWSLLPRKGYKICHLENKIEGWQVKFIFATGEWGFSTRRQVPTDKPDNEPLGRMTKEMKRALTLFSEDREDIRWYFEANNPIALETYGIATVKHSRRCRNLGFTKFHKMYLTCVND